ncbi:DUF7010 family protein [Muriicola soli]|uniref:Uncharacterized protein n=1 Tax=Muriicola soli TaxID=2507538 RepID=A0A411E8J8_9FLAO|nr:hypothetical protein [Muriicola soli]QBA64009.1 hypothetical protein EQY75_05330 [Muriicola soli]
MKNRNLAELKLEIQLQAKYGIEFMVSAGIIWCVIAYIWTLEYSSFDRSILTFIVGAVMLPLAFGLSKIFKTKWKIKDNPLDSLGLWLNFAQLIYFPFLIFTLLKFPDYFIMAYAIITGAHLFPYAWFYDEIGYAVFAVVISVGALLITLNVDASSVWIVPLFTAGSLFLLAGWIGVRISKSPKKQGAH